MPPDDPRSNYRLVREALLDRLEQPPAAVHRVEGECGAAEAAALYDGTRADRQTGDDDSALLRSGPVLDAPATALL